MKNIIYHLGTILLPLVGCTFMLGCSDNDNSSVGGDEQVYAINSVSLTMEESAGSLTAGTRATVSGFIVNRADDPTHNFDNKLGWTLDIAVYKGNAPYAEGSGTFLWNGDYWEEENGDDIYMPHYLFQNVAADLYPASWTSGGETIVTDQRNLTTFIEQDILEQNGDPTYRTVPAHYLEVQMRHSHSMIDFVLAEVNKDDIASVTVTAGGLVYEPYKVPITTREEYLVILPLGINNPVINVSTYAGAKYHKELDIQATLVNTCYYVRLVGLDLVLEGLTVSNWVTGEAVAGDYTSPTSYPTFRGPVDVTVEVFYDNDVSQTMTFNEKGEAVERPAGRTIVKVETVDGEYVLPAPYTIRTMIVDLNPYIEAIGS